MADDNQQMKLKAEVYYWVAQRARNRFETRRAIEWKTMFGLWTVLFIGTGFVLNATAWTPSGLDACVGTIFVILLMGVFCRWMKYLESVNTEDRNESINWEKKMLACVEDDPPNAEVNPPTYCWPFSEIPSACQFWWTIVFALLFVLCLGFRAWGGRDGVATPPSTISITGGTLDGTTELKLGTQRE